MNTSSSIAQSLQSTRRTVNLYTGGGRLNLGDGSRRQGILCGCDLQEVNKTKIVFVPQQYNIELRLEIRRHHRITSRRLPTQTDSTKQACI